MERVDWKISRAVSRMKRRREMFLARRIALKTVMIAGLVAATALFTGARGYQQTEVSEKYTVQPNDTLWNIAESYLTKDDRRMYIFEYIDEIKLLNPELVESKGQILPGQVIKVNYVKNVIPQE